MSTPSTSEPQGGFVCNCKEWMRSACAGEYLEKEGNRYCLMHFPGNEKSTDFKKALQKKLENNDFNFRGVWFPDGVTFQDGKFNSNVNFQEAAFSTEISFKDATFYGEADFNRVKFHGRASFHAAVFEAVTFFGGATFFAAANFRSARFKGLANFNTAIFKEQASFNFVVFTKGSIFDGAVFDAAAEFQDDTFIEAANLSSVTFIGEANFNRSTFGGRTNFIKTTFGKKADFVSATFAGLADFSFATFLNQATFEGSSRAPFDDARSALNLKNARVERVDDVSFHTLRLHPHWFVNVDARKFDFINVRWANSGHAGPELELLEQKGISSRHSLLAIACRKLAANADEHDRYREASHFRRMAMDSERMGGWRRFGLMSWWYWMASGYGERPFQAFLILLAIMLLFTVLYMQVGFARWEPRLATESDAATVKRDEVGAPLSFRRALTYSAGVITLQRPEPRPATTPAQTIVLLETVLGPFQAALLALAIRRKFMR